MTKMMEKKPKLKKKMNMAARGFMDIPFHPSAALGCIPRRLHRHTKLSDGCTFGDWSKGKGKRERNKSTAGSLLRWFSEGSKLVLSPAVTRDSILGGAPRKPSGQVLTSAASVMTFRMVEAVFTSIDDDFDKSRLLFEFDRGLCAPLCCASVAMMDEEASTAALSSRSSFGNGEDGFMLLSWHLRMYTIHINLKKLFIIWKSQQKLCRQDVGPWKLFVWHLNARTCEASSYCRGNQEHEQIKKE